MSQGVARILLCGILSDTINLMSPTTTDADRIALVMLTAVARVDDLDLVVRFFILCYERATERERERESNETSY
jgi:inorganic pyrophosphatase/exopolyphosphatase